MTVAQDCPPRTGGATPDLPHQRRTPPLFAPDTRRSTPTLAGLSPTNADVPEHGATPAPRSASKGSASVSPQKSGLHRSKKLPPQPPLRSPRVNGAAPQPLFLHNDRQIPPPSTRGCTPYIILGIEPNTDLPGHPGLRLQPLHGPFAGLPFPPSRGAAPIRPPRRGLMRTLSPDTRGYASQSHTHPVDTSAFPERTGIHHPKRQLFVDTYHRSQRAGKEKKSGSRTNDAKQERPKKGQHRRNAKRRESR